MVVRNTKEYIAEKKSQGLYGWDDSFSVHPGGTLKDEIEFLGLTQTEVAARVGCTVQTISRIVNEWEPITLDIALKLERVFGGHPSAQFWVNMQAACDRQCARVKDEKAAEKEIGLFNDALRETFKELQRLKVFESFRLYKESFRKAVLSMKSFFEVSTLEDISDKKVLGVAFRKYNSSNLNQYNLAALLKIGEKKMREALKRLQLKEYSEDIFSKKLNDIKTLTTKKPSVFLKELQEVCLECGVVVVYVPNIKHTYFGGAITWMGGRPIVMLKVEKQHEDIFWFNFFHEAGHILKHSRKEFFVDFENGEKTEIEKEADTFAQTTLIPNFEALLNESSKIKGVSIESWLETASQSVGVTSSIIAGRICNDWGKKNVNIWRFFSSERQTIQEKVGAI